MPAAVPEKSDRSEQMWKALRTHILSDRARKKQEREAEVEEERLRKERAAREEQDVMTLGETREQILQLQRKMEQLKDEKHQLFLQLKKVLNADDSRRKQFVKESNEVLTLPGLQCNELGQHPLYVQQPVQRVTVQQGFKSISKRPRSPSPQPQPTAPTTIYHPSYSYKVPSVISSYQSAPQSKQLKYCIETQQYPNQPGSFYPVPQELPIYYPPGPIPSRDPTRAMYENSRPQAYHMEQKPMEHYTLRPPSSHAHVIHATPMSLNQVQAPVKSSNMANAYPVRTQTQYQQSVPTSALYTTQSRPLYQSPGAPLNYQGRE